MRLNYDCVRDVLLKLEELLDCSAELSGDNASFKFQLISLEQLYKNMDNRKYSIKDVFYVVYNLDQAEYIKFGYLPGCGYFTNCYITGITYEGHQFLQNIRPKKIWDKSKTIFQNLGTISVDIIKSVTSSILEEKIKSYLP